MKDQRRILFANSEILPFLPETKISTVGRYLPQGIQESGKEIRTFMPRYGNINERRNQLHEVIRLSGMNIVINELDRPLIIKVSSIPAARKQVYFIDNDDYFHRKFIYHDADGNEFPDNDERAMFYARGILETVKKLRWAPDMIHCQGWISNVLPLYLKKTYHNDPIFSNSKVILSIYDEELDMTFDEAFKKKILINGVKNKDVEQLAESNGVGLAKLAIKFADGVIFGSPNTRDEIRQYIQELNIPILEYTPIDHPDNTYINSYNEFYDRILNDNEV